MGSCLARRTPLHCRRRIRLARLRTTHPTHRPTRPRRADSRRSSSLRASKSRRRRTPRRRRRPPGNRSAPGSRTCRRPPATIQRQEYSAALGLAGAGRPLTAAVHAVALRAVAIRLAALGLAQPAGATAHAAQIRRACRAGARVTVTVGIAGIRWRAVAIGSASRRAEKTPPARGACGRDGDVSADAATTRRVGGAGERRRARAHARPVLRPSAIAVRRAIGTRVARRAAIDRGLRVPISERRVARGRVVRRRCLSVGPAPRCSVFGRGVIAAVGAHRVGRCGHGSR